MNVCSVEPKVYKPQSNILCIINMQPHRTTTTRKK